MKQNNQFRNLLSIVILAWIVAFLLMFFIFKDWGTRGQFGDMFGALNVLFSGFAFAALYFTISLQQKQLQHQDELIELQREDLRLQRVEMVASRGELARQADAQDALTRATVAQVRVASFNAEIEAQKLWIDTPNRQSALIKIQETADKLADLAQKLEQTR
jgi:hypothetical protein